MQRSIVAASTCGSAASTSSRSADTAADSSALRAGASPSQNGIVGGCPRASSTRTRPASHPQDPVGAVAELEHIAGEALDREVLVQRADEGARRFEHDR